MGLPRIHGGFALSPEERQPILVARKQAAKPPTRKKPADETPGGVGCDNCTLKDTWGTIASPRMPTSGRLDTAEILVLGEAPGKTEDALGKQFVGDSGKLLKKYIDPRDYNLVAFTNTCRCRPPENRTPTPQEAHACRIYLDDDAAKMPKLKCILGVGNVPLSHFFPGGQIMKVHGTKFPVQIGDRVLWYYPVMHPAFVLRMGENIRSGGPVLPVFVADMKRLFREWTSWPKPVMTAFTPNSVTIPADEAEARALVATMAEPLAIDIETAVPIKDTVPKPYHKEARLLTAAISDGQTTIAFPIDHPQAKTDWGLRLLLDCAETKHWLAHNVAYELIWILAKQAEINRPQSIAKFEDTMAQARLYHARESIQSLGDLTQVHLGTNVKRIAKVDTKNLLKSSLPDVLTYNGLDAMATALLHKALNKQRINKANYKRILDTQESVVRMELLGLPISHEILDEIRQEWKGKADRLVEHAKTIYEVREFERTYQKEFNIASTEHVSTALVTFGKLNLPKTKGKKHEVSTSTRLSTDDQVLSKHAADNPLAKTVLEYREAAKLVSTYVDAPEDAYRKTTDGLLHPGYTVTLTRTGRLSSENPNIQNFPKRKHREVRRQIVAPPGHLIVPCDYGQLEARVLGMASRDEYLCQSTITGYDIHSEWLDKTIQYYPAYLDRLAEKAGLVGADEKKIRKRGRDTIKGDFVFASLYGSGAPNIAERTGIPHHIVEEILAEFWGTFKGVKKWHKKVREEYVNTGISTTLTGRKRQGILRSNESVNTPIQGTAADIVLAAQNELTHMAVELDDPYFQPRINIHDDLTFILPDDARLEAYIETIQAVMVKVRFHWQVVPLIVEVKAGPDWANVEDVAVFEGEYHQ